jgi:hypothetical protein
VQGQDLLASRGDREQDRVGAEALAGVELAVEIEILDRVRGDLAGIEEAVQVAPSGTTGTIRRISPLP